MSENLKPVRELEIEIVELESRFDLALDPLAAVLDAGDGCGNSCNNADCGDNCGTGCNNSCPIETE